MGEVRQAMGGTQSMVPQMPICQTLQGAEVRGCCAETQQPRHPTHGKEHRCLSVSPDPR